MEEHNYKVYMHVCPNNKKYIGITKQEPKYRWGHGTNYSNNKYFTNAIKKYNWENIEHKILYEHLTKKEAEQKEIELISYYKTIQSEYGYNILKGGNVSNGLSNETRKIIADKIRGRKLTKEHKEKIKRSLQGRKMSEEWKQKISKSLIGKKKSKDSIEKGRLKKIGKSPWNKGKNNIYSKETLKKMSQNTKKMWQNKEFRNAIMKN